MWKAICLTVFLYIACLSIIVNGNEEFRSHQKTTLLQQVQNNIRSLLSDRIGKEITVNGETYIIDSVLGIVPPGVSAHKYSQYWDDAEFLNSAFLQLKIDVLKVPDVDNLVTPTTKETFVFSDNTFVAKGGNGKVYKGIKYKSDGAKDTTLDYVIKEVASRSLADKECTEYTSLPQTPAFVKCYGSTDSLGKGYAVLEDGGPDISMIIKDRPHVHSDTRKRIVKGLVTALKILFDAGKTHRDVKPGNACYKNKKLKLIDFGWLYDWGTEVTVPKIDTVQANARHGTPLFKWPAVTSMMEYKVSDKVSAGTKQAYIDKVRSKFYLIDMGGVFLTHISMITHVSAGQIHTAGDVFQYYTAEHDRNDDGKTFWVRYHVLSKERAVLKALKNTDKSFADILAMDWFK